MAVIGVLSALVVLRFWLIGAWPVAGFGVVEVGVAIFLLRLNASRARASELVLLSEGTLRIVRTDRRGRRQQRVLPAAWLNATLEEPPGQVPRLLLVAHGVREEIAATLGEAEKRDLWAALCDAQCTGCEAPASTTPSYEPTVSSSVSPSRAHRLDQVEHALAHRGIGDAVVGTHQFKRLAPVERIVGKTVLHLGEARPRGGGAWPP